MLKSSLYHLLASKKDTDSDADFHRSSAIVGSILYFAVCIGASARLYTRAMQYKTYLQRQRTSLHRNRQHEETEQRKMVMVALVLTALVVYSLARTVTYILVGVEPNSQFTGFSGHIQGEVPAILYLVMVQFLILVWNHQVTRFLSSMNERHERGMIAVQGLWLALLGHLIVVIAAAIAVSVYDEDDHAWNMALKSSTGVVSALCGIVFVYLGHKLRSLLSMFAADPEVKKARHKATVVSMTLGTWCIIRGVWMATFPIGDNVPIWREAIESEVSYFMFSFAEFIVLVVSVAWLLKGNAASHETDDDPDIQGSYMPVGIHSATLASNNLPPTPTSTRSRQTQEEPILEE